ncbi:MAG: hypothetical protein ABFE16_11920 [Armatimonadia bacterium]
MMIQTMSVLVTQILAVMVSLGTGTNYSAVQTISVGTFAPSNQPNFLIGSISLSRVRVSDPHYKFDGWKWSAPNSSGTGTPVRGSNETYKDGTAKITLAGGLQSVSWEVSVITPDNVEHSLGTGTVTKSTPPMTGAMYQWNTVAISGESSPLIAPNGTALPAYVRNDQTTIYYGPTGNNTVTYNWSALNQWTKESTQNGGEGFADPFVVNGALLGPTWSGYPAVPSMPYKLQWRIFKMF